MTTDQLDTEFLEKEYELLIKSSNSLILLLKDAIERSKKIIDEYKSLQEYLDK